MITKRIHIHKKGTAYLGKWLIENGFSGQCDALITSKAIIIVHPSASLADLRNTLKILVTEIGLQLVNQFVGSGPKGIYEALLEAREEEKELEKRREEALGLYDP